MTGKCFFCDAQQLDDGKIFLQSENFYARWDDIPVNPGHCEVVPKQHIDSYFALSGEQARELHGLVQQVSVMLHELYEPEGYTIGINEGEASGRTQNHLHLHIIPRYLGDVDAPKAGIRNIIPEKGVYDAWALTHGRGHYLDK